MDPMPMHAPATMQAPMSMHAPAAETAAVDQEARARLEEVLKTYIGTLETLANAQVAKKLQKEEQWLEDLRQFHGQYDAETMAELVKGKKSRVFVGLTRAKTNAWEARLSDMLYPTDDKNWGIKPTPNPRMAMAIEGGDEDVVAKQTEAEKRADAMEREIDDKLREARYNIKSRDAIHDACVIGTGIMKGPLLSSKTLRKWTPVVDRLTGRTEQVLTEVEDKRPDYQRVDPWNYFPDMNARRKGEEEFEFERHLLNKKKLRELAKKPGFDKAAIAELLRNASPSTVPNYVTQLQAITNSGATAIEPMYQVWEYHGPIEGQDLQNLLGAIGKADEIEDYSDDPLESVQAIIWFCQGRLLKFGLHPLDSSESLYSVFNLEQDDSSLFGFGIPFLMRHSQRAINAGWRMALDNAGLSTGPQIVINRKIVEPADGSWDMTPRKVWYANQSQGQPLDHAFKTYNVDSHQAELLNIVKKGEELADEETNLPVIAQGEQGSHTTQTSGGMAMLMNSVNVVFRRVVKNYDDDMTTPNIRRMYDWLMQFGENDDIKGDFEVDARGSSVLLVREVQAQNLMAMALQFSNHPVLGKYTKAVPLYRSLVQAHMLPADRIVTTDDEIALMEKNERENPPPPPPEILKLQLEMQLAQFNGHLQLTLAQMTRETALVQMAVTQKMKLADLKAKLGIAAISSDTKQKTTATTTNSKERVFAAEAALKQRTGEGI